jgi:hypothetical protein
VEDSLLAMTSDENLSLRESRHEHSSDHTITNAPLLNTGRIGVIERDKTYQSCSAMLSAGGIRQQFSVPENVKMSMYGAEFIKNMESLGNSVDYALLTEYLILVGTISRILNTRQFITQSQQ